MEHDRIIPAILKYDDIETHGDSALMPEENRLKQPQNGMP